MSGSGEYENRAVSFGDQSSKSFRFVVHLYDEQFLLDEFGRRSCSCNLNPDRVGHERPGEGLDL
jgi:hypothetical protein